MEQIDGMAFILGQIAGERIRQHEKWGEQNHPDGTGAKWYQTQANAAKARCQQNVQAGVCTYRDILIEEVYEALAERDPLALRQELIQVAAVCVQWVQAIDRRTASAKLPFESRQEPPPSYL